MMRVLAAAMLLMLGGLPTAEAEVIAPGHLLIVKGHIQGCSAESKVIDFVEVPASGEVVFFEKVESLVDVALSVNGLDVEEIAELIADALEQYGSRPQTLIVVRATAKDLREARSQLIRLSRGMRKISCADHPDIRDMPQLKPIRLVSRQSSTSTVSTRFRAA